jgi:DNA-binding IclR family transcriptional regulator
MTPDKADSHSGSIARALAVLEFLDGSQRGWNISELSRKLEVPKSTMHLILLTLERLGYVSREPGSRDYSLSVKVCELGRSLMKNVMMPDIALPHLEDLVRQVRLTAHLAVLEHDQAMYVQKVDCPGLIKFDTYVGKRTNLHCTAVGKVLLAYSPESKSDRILQREPFARYTRHTITSAILLRKELVKVRQRGYAVDDEEEELEVRCVAVPVFRPTGEFVAALGVTGTVGQMRPDMIASLAIRMRETGQNIIRGSRRTVRQRSA